MKLILLILSLLLGFLNHDAQAAVERVWMSFTQEDASVLCVQWETKEAVPTQMKWKPEASAGQLFKAEKPTRQHRIEVPFTQRGGIYRYQLWDGHAWMPLETVKALPQEELRIAMVGDWGFATHRDLSSVLKAEPHLLVTLGDNVPNLYQDGKKGTDAYRALIDEYPQIFRRIPFMSILGNHDHEIQPRGKVKYPPEAVYDTSAKAYRDFFALPSPEYLWELRFNDFGVRLLSLALHHLSDVGTTWQSAPAWHESSEQFLWYQSRVNQPFNGFTLTLMNENARFADRAEHAFWKQAFLKSDALLTGFGYFGERSLIDDELPYYNTCLKGDGDVYAHPQSKFLTREHHYLWITAKAGAPKLQVEFRSLESGKVLDRSELSKGR